MTRSTTSFGVALYCARTSLRHQAIATARLSLAALSVLALCFGSVAEAAVTDQVSFDAGLDQGQNTPTPFRRHVQPAAQPHLRLAQLSGNGPLGALFSLFAPKPAAVPVYRTPPTMNSNTRAMPGYRAYAPYSSGLQQSQRPAGALRGGTRTMCVRTCDGYYWPVSFNVTSSRLSHDRDTCESSCSGEARLYTISSHSDNIAEMRDLSGRRYKKLKTAFRYRTVYDASCTCRPQPWTEAAKNRHRRYAAIESESTEQKQPNSSTVASAKTPLENSPNSAQVASLSISSNHNTADMTTSVVVSTPSNSPTNAALPVSTWVNPRWGFSGTDPVYKPRARKQFIRTRKPRKARTARNSRRATKKKRVANPKPNGWYQGRRRRR